VGFGIVAKPVRRKLRADNVHIDMRLGDVDACYH
jgi:hypothetical protein